MKIDGIRISDVWSDVGLPVQLSSFSALRVTNDVQLSWNTISEVNNFGFYRRAQAGRHLVVR